MIDAARMPLPEADSQLKLRIAFSAVGFATTGGTRRTSLSSPGIGIFGAEIPSSSDLVCGSPQTNTTTLRMIHGSQARRIADRVVSEARALARAPSAAALPDGRASDTTRSLRLPFLTSCSQIRFGCQNRRNSASEPIETIAAT